MNKKLLDLIKTKLKLIESCKKDSFHTMMIYSESLPSLLVQCIGYIENKINKDYWTLHIDSMNNLVQDESINKSKKSEDKILSQKWKPYLDDNRSILDEYKNIKIFNQSNQQEFDTALNYLLHQDNLFIFTERAFKNLKIYRNDYSHGKINSRRLSIISKQDFYVYFGILLLIDKCIDDIITNIPS